MHTFLLLFVCLLHCTSCNAQMPSWNTTQPNLTVNASAGLSPINAMKYIIFNHSLHSNGTYSNGAIPILWKNNFYVSWYNTLTGKESNDMRVLYATSLDGKIWNNPIEVFPNFTHVGEENEPWLIINDRLYASASMYNYPFEPLMRQLTGPLPSDPKGKIFWLTDEVPPGLERRCNLTYLDMDNVTTSDMKQYLASLVKTETVPGGEFDTVTFNERSLYLIPGSTHNNEQQLMLLMRTNDNINNARDWQWASTCTNTLKYNVVTNAVLNGCRPGIGVLHWNLVNIVDGKANNVHNLERCNWTKPIQTNIQNAPARTCTSVLPDGRIYLIGNIALNREVLILAVSTDGYSFEKAWAVRYNENGGHDSFEYPAAVWDDSYLYVTYTINKNDVQTSIVKLSDITT